MRKLVRIVVLASVLVLTMTMVSQWSFAGPGTTPVALTTSPTVTKQNIPGDDYVDKAVTAHLKNLAAKDKKKIERRIDGFVNINELRTAAFGRYASMKMGSFKVRDVYDEKAYSGKGPSYPATAWSATANVRFSAGGKTRDIDVKLTGLYGCDGSVESAVMVGR